MNKVWINKIKFVKKKKEKHYKKKKRKSVGFVLK